MAKNRANAADGPRDGALRDRSPVNGEWVKRDSRGRFVDTKSNSTPFKGVRREILFPTEPSTIGHRKIDRAVKRVVSRKK